MPGTIEELKGLLERSSPLPWRHNQWMNTRNNTVMADEVKSAGHVIVKDVHREEDVSLIVSAVNSLPALIACALALRDAQAFIRNHFAPDRDGWDGAPDEAIRVEHIAEVALDKLAAASPSQTGGK